jgi:geranylgeranyl pyrophosphate synthase
MIIENYKKNIETYLEEHFILSFPEKIRTYLNYILLDGKKLRSILFLLFSGFTSSNTSNNSLEQNIIHDSVIDDCKIRMVFNGCCTVELIHCLSLIIDDLPEMDDDSERRGKPTFHMKFGIEITNFFIYYIVNKLNSLINIYSDSNSDSDSNILFNQMETCKNRLDYYLEDMYYNSKKCINSLLNGQYLDLNYDSLSPMKLIEKLDDNYTNTNIIYNIIVKFIYPNIVSDGIHVLSKLKENIILNINKTGTLFTLPIINGFIMQLWRLNIPYNMDLYLADVDDLLCVYNYSSGSILQRLVKNTTSKTSTSTSHSHSRIDSVNDISNAELANIYKKYNDYGKSNLRLKTILDGEIYLPHLIKIVYIWANILGYIFQISDDLLDEKQDKLKGKPNICSVIGFSNGLKLLKNSNQWLKKTLEIIDKNIKKLFNTEDLVKQNQVKIHMDGCIEIIDMINARIKCHEV